MSNNIPEGVELPKGAKIGEHETDHIPQEFTYAKPKEETEHEQNR